MSATRESSGTETKASRGRAAAPAQSSSKPSGKSARSSSASRRSSARSSNGKRSSSGAGRASAARNGTQSSKSGSPSSRSSSRPSRSSSPAPKGATGSAAGNGGRGSRPGSHLLDGKLVGLGVSVASATMGVAGGVILGRHAVRGRRRVLGVPVPDKVDLTGVADSIGEAGRQLGRLAGEVSSVRQKAEQIARILS